MQVTYNNLPADSLNKDFWETIKARFSGKNISIIVTEDEKSAPQNQEEMFQKMEKLRKKLKKIRVDPEIDLSALANEVNL